MALGSGSIKEAGGSSQWFLSLHSAASGLQKPLLAWYVRACAKQAVFYAISIQGCQELTLLT